MSAAELLAAAWPTLYASGKVGLAKPASKPGPARLDRDYYEQSGRAYYEKKRNEMWAAGLTSHGRRRVRSWQSLAGMTDKEVKERKRRQKRDYWRRKVALKSEAE